MARQVINIIQQFMAEKLHKFNKKNIYHNVFK